MQRTSDVNVFEVRRRIVLTLLASMVLTGWDVLITIVLSQRGGWFPATVLMWLVTLLSVYFISHHIWNIESGLTFIIEPMGYNKFIGNPHVHTVLLRCLPVLCIGIVILFATA